MNPTGEHTHYCTVCNRYWKHKTAIACTWAPMTTCNDCEAREDDKPSALRILPAADDPAEAIAREVAEIAHLPLVGAVKLKFVAIDRAVMQGNEWKCTACSHTMARRIANALENYSPGQKGY